jgi:hypothetical protein
MENCNPNWTPAATSALRMDPNGKLMTEEWSYPSIVGMLLYLSTNARPDIAVTVSHLAAQNSRNACGQNIGHFHYFLSEMYNNDTFSRLITANFFSFHSFPFHLHYFQFYSGAPQVLLMKRWSLLKHWSDHYPHWTIDNISS